MITLWKVINQGKSKKDTQLACKYLQIFFLYILFSVFNNALFPSILFSCFPFLKHTATKKKNKKHHGTETPLRNLTNKTAAIIQSNKNLQKNAAASKNLFCPKMIINVTWM